MKKILFILFLFTFSLGFAQQNEKSKETITKVSCYPNPFDTETNIRFYSIKKQKVKISVKNLLGKVVYANEFRISRGNVSIPFYKDNLISGTYFYTIQTGDEIISKRLILK